MRPPRQPRLPFPVENGTVEDVHDRHTVAVRLLESGGSAVLTTWGFPPDWEPQAGDDVVVAYMPEGTFACPLVSSAVAPLSDSEAGTLAVGGLRGIVNTESVRRSLQSVRQAVSRRPAAVCAGFVSNARTGVNRCFGIRVQD